MFEDARGLIRRTDNTTAKGLIRSRKSKDRQCNGGMKSTQTQKKTLPINLKIEKHERHIKPRWIVIYVLTFALDSEYMSCIYKNQHQFREFHFSKQTLRQSPII